MWIAQFIILMILEVNTYNYNTTISNNETISTIQYLYTRYESSTEMALITQRR